MSVVKYRVPVAPAIVVNGIITFNSIELMIEERLIPSEDVMAKTSTHLVSIKSSEPISIYIDETKEPKFSKCSPGEGWVSPPAEKLKTMREAGIEPEFSLHIHCKCQRGELSHEDVRSLERCGHSRQCSKADPEPFETGNVFKDRDGVFTLRTATPAKKIGPEPPKGDPEILKMVEENREIKPKEDMRPPGGVWRDETIPDLAAQLSGSSFSDMNIDNALEAIGWKEPFDMNVVSKQLTRAGFMVCGKCNTWQYVMNSLNPTCIGCQAT